MKRQLKFRAFSKNSKEMYEVFSFCDAYVKIIVGIGTASKLPINIFEPIMQFTGLTDKNGVEIYEGDIIKNAKGDLAILDYNGFSASFKPRSYYGGCANWYLQINEVIGNIHQNPELL